MKLIRVIKHKRYVSAYLFSIKINIINTTLTASRGGGLSVSCIDRIHNNAMLIRKYERRMKILKY